MQKLRIDLLGYAPKETDRLIVSLLNYLKTASFDIQVEFGQQANPVVLIPVFSSSGVKGKLPLLQIADFKSSDYGFCRQEDSSHASGRTVLPADADFLAVPIEKILYVTSDRHYCDFHLDTGTCRIRINFCDVESLLASGEFLACSRGVLLSMAHIAEQRADSFVMTDGAAFPLRTKHKKEIIRQYESYQFLHG